MEITVLNRSDPVDSMAQTVKQIYEEITYPGLEDKPNFHIVARLKKYVSKKAYILDAGCGTGHHLLGVAMSYPGCEISGIDFSAPSIEVAKALFEKHGRTATFHVGDYTLPMPFENRFDLIILNGTIHHTPNPALSLKNVVNYLSDQGFVYIMVYGKKSHQRRLEVKEMLHLLEPEGSTTRYAYYVDLLKRTKKSPLRSALDLSLSDLIQWARDATRILRNSLKGNQAFSRSKSMLKYRTVKYDRNYRDSFDIPIQHTYDTWKLKELLEEAGLEPVEFFTLGRNNPKLLPPSWVEAFNKLGCWEKQRIMELLEPDSVSFSFIARKKGGPS